MDNHFHVAHLLDTVNNYFLKISFTQKLYELSYLCQDIFLSGNVPNYRPTHHEMFLL
jgi:hypothetical protein